MPGRSYNSAEYRYGFNGQEKDDEVYGSGNINTAEFWQYDTRLGRRWNVDPVVKPWESGYMCFHNTPIFFVDYYGDDPTDPRTGNKVSINLLSTSIVRLDYSHRITTDVDLYQRAQSQWNQLLYAHDDGKYGPGLNQVSVPPLDRGIHGLSDNAKNYISSKFPVTDEVSYDQSNSISKLYTTPQLSLIGKAALLGNYTYFKNDKVEWGPWIDLDNFTMVRVVQNELSEISNFKRDAESNQFYLESVVGLQTVKSDVKIREGSALFGLIKHEEKYRTVTVTETTTYYSKSGDISSITQKIYNREESVE